MLYTIKLNKNKDFVRLYTKGAFVSGGICTVYFRKNGTDKNRFGITTGKKIGNAVSRSRARSEAFKLIFQMNQKLKFLQIQWNRHRKMQEMM